MITETNQQQTDSFYFQSHLDKTSLTEAYRSVRDWTARLCKPLQTEDYIAQSMPDASPTKWHLAHTTWFFENFILEKLSADHRSDSGYSYLFNSYYVQMGNRYPRAQRGLITRPTVAEVVDYRQEIDGLMLSVLEEASEDVIAVVGPLIEIGIHHEQQHQELLLTDLKHLFYCNPLYPNYRSLAEAPLLEPGPQEWVPFEEGIYRIGHTGARFCYDNELPRHRVFLEPFSLSSRLVTNGEYLAFLEDEGYQRQTLWLDQGWEVLQQNGWRAPLYWIYSKDGWQIFTLNGLRPLRLEEPVCHVSYYEADAFARWSGARLPSEMEWEAAASSVPAEGNFLEQERYHPGGDLRQSAASAVGQTFGDVWEWTQSAYLPYPGYQPMPGAVGEYNGKFMSGQMVLRGGSCVTSQTHIRASYRNFFYPNSRWQFSGIRMAKQALGS